MSSYLPTKGEDVVRESRDGGISDRRGTNSAPCCIVCAGSVPHEALVCCSPTNYPFLLICLKPMDGSEILSADGYTVWLIAGMMLCC